jgi:hypothetical protein
MAPECPTCSFRFKRNPGHWLGSWFLSICVVQTVLVVVLIAEVALSWPDRPPLAQVLALPVVAVVLPLAFFPLSRTLWSAIDLVMRPLELDEGVAPVVELEQLDALARRARPAAGVTVSRPLRRPEASGGSPDGP